MTTTYCTRRKALATATGSACALALAACGDDSSGPSTGGYGEPADSEDPTPTEDPSKPTDGRQAIAALDDVPVGGARTVKTPDGDEVVLVRPDDTTVVAYSAVCTHQGGIVQPEGDDTLRCPLHQSAFDAATGDVLEGPAEDPLAPVKVRVDGDQIVAA